MKSWEHSTLYGLRPFEPADWVFALGNKGDTIQHGGCYSYELHRQRVAIALKRKEPEFDLGRLKATWEQDFALPWPQLPPAQREYWCDRYRAEKSRGGLEFVKVGTPSKWPGECFQVTVDWDLNDRELARRFQNSLKRHRPAPPKVEINEKPITMLKALVAARLFDCRPDLTTKVEDIVAETESFLMGQNLPPLFASKHSFQHALRAHLKVLDTITLTLMPDLSYRIAMRK
jgi:hypothetical protein